MKNLPKPGDIVIAAKGALGEVQELSTCGTFAVVRFSEKSVAVMRRCDLKVLVKR